ncbi:hypothetical protein [Allokutzneria oryzae]|uniref:Uncharacterized protein n=1 Tax=Allokutzneria oryzae TaxID=1378989 RepID=A0ABV6A0W1_9PSEU
MPRPEPLPADGRTGLLEPLAEGYQLRLPRPASTGDPATKAGL